MKFVKSYRILSIFLLFILLSSTFFSAQLLNAQNKIPYIDDQASLLSSEEIEAYDSICDSLNDSLNVGIYVLTHNNKNSVNGDQYIEDYYDNVLFQNQPNSVILLIDMYRRDVIIHGYGKGEIYIHSKRGDKIIDKISPYLSNGNYSEAISKFIKMSHEYLLDDSDLNYDHDYIYDVNGKPLNKALNPKSIYFNIFAQLAVSIIIGIIVVGSMLSASSGRITVGSSSYLDHSKPGLIGRHDSYITTQIKKVRRPDASNSSNGRSSGYNSSGHRGGTSSGGRSHSSSRGKF